VPVLPGPLFDDGDLVVFNKPSGLPVLPAGGFLQHTVLGQLALVAPGARPVHRLGRFTSGLLVCARSRQARAWLSAQLRDSTARSAAAAVWAPDTGSGAGPHKVYRTLLSQPEPGSALLQLAVGETLPLETPIGRRPHGRLGSLWCAAAPGDGGALPARSLLTLLEPRADGWLVQVAIATGRPHQIRIHTAAAGALLLGDPLYLPGGLARADALPGDGGYQLHAHRLSLSPPDGSRLSLEAPLPQVLQIATTGQG
jgi:23S rRNA pseudouridine1911/1915/1917 synthase